MEETLAKIDLIRERLGVSYKDAQEALEANEGDVIKALVYLEEKMERQANPVSYKGKELVAQLRHIMGKSHETKVKLKKGDETVVEIPATVGALGLLGTLASSQLALVGMIGSIAALANNYSLELDPPQKENDVDKNA